jgi:type IV pilus assembly protein PilM
MARQVLCLDWDKRSLRVVVAGVGAGSIRLVDAHTQRVPAGVEVSEPAAMGAFIAATLERHKIRMKKCVVDVPRDLAVINRLRLPPTPTSEVAAAVRFQALRELPFPLEDAQIDYAVLERDGAKNVTEVLLAAVRNDGLSRLKATCTAAGLTPTRIGLRPCANMLSVLRLPATLERRVLFVDVGPSITEIDVFRGSTLVFSRAASVSVPFQGGELVGDSSRIISRSSIANLEESDDAEDTTVEELVVEMLRTLQAYRAVEPGGVIDQIVLAGGTGVEHALLRAVEAKFSLPTTLYDPTTALGVDASEAAKLRSFSAALGLAWGMSREGQLEIDFLNPKRPIVKSEVLKRRAQLSLAAAVLAVGVLLSWVVVDRVSLNRRLDALRDRNQPKLKQFETVALLQVRTEEAEDWNKEERIAAWLDPLLKVTTAAVDPGKKMIITDWTSVMERDRASIALKLACDSIKTAEEFAQKLESETDAKGRRIYDVRLGSWTETKTGSDKFKGGVQADVSVRDPYFATLKEEETRRTELKKVP